MTPTSVLAQRNLWVAVVSTVVPVASRLNEREWRVVEELIGTAIENRPRALARQLRMFLHLLKWVPVLRYGKPFTALSPSDRKRVLEYLESHQFQLLRAAFWGLRTLAMLGYYCRP
ncbi:MAG: hypothetical protein ACJ73N_13530 [Bryobacteraceae bacterium]